MGRTRVKAKGRRGGEGEHFARLPESILQHPGMTTAPHYALRALAALVCGYSERQNGSMMLTGSYAAKFGLTSHDTLTKALRLLEERGFIETTRRVSRRMKIAMLFAVTWWEIHYRNGERLDRPEPASHRYRQLDHPAPRDEESTDPGFSSSRPTGDVIPPDGMNGASHHPELTPFRPSHHPAPRGHSENLGGGAEQGACTPSVATQSAVQAEQVTGARADSNGLAELEAMAPQKVFRRMIRRDDPNLTDEERAELERRVQVKRAQLATKDARRAAREMN